MPKLTREKEKLLRDTLTKFPTYTDERIGKQLKLTRQTVLKFRHEITTRHDSEFIAITAGKFIAAFGTASDYWYSQLSELEELKHKKKTIFKKGKDGQSYPEQVDLEPMDILAICKQQAELQKMVLFLASQGEVKEVIKVMRSGKLSVLDS